MRLLLSYWPSTSMGRQFLLTEQPEDATVAALPVNQELERLKGRIGRTLSALRPAGMIDFDGRRIDTITEGTMVDPGQMVRCIDVKRAGRGSAHRKTRPRRSGNGDFQLMSSAARSLAECVSPAPYASPSSPNNGDTYGSYPFCSGPQNPVVLPTQSWLVIVLIIAGLAALVVLFVFFSFVQLWIQCFLTGARSASWT